MTIQSPGFTKPSSLLTPRTPAPAQAVVQRFSGPIWTTIAAALLLSGCAAELEDPEAYTTRVLPGAGASGVAGPQGVKVNPVQPGVSPQQTNDVDPDVQPGVSPQQTNDVDPGSDEPDETSSGVAPQPSVSPTSDVSPGGGVSAECEDTPTRILQGKCGGVSCHGEPNKPTMFFSDIASSTDPLHLLDVPAKIPCDGKMLIDSENPAESAILSVIQADDHCSGSRMPASGTYLTDDEARCLTEWVNAAATGAL